MGKGKHVPRRHRVRCQEIILALTCCERKVLDSLLSQIEGVDIIEDSATGTYVINAPNRYCGRIQRILKKNKIMT